MSKTTYIIAGISLAAIGLILWMRQPPAQEQRAELGSGDTGANPENPENRVINALGTVGNVAANLYERWTTAVRRTTPAPPQPGRMPPPAQAPMKPPVRRP